MIDIEAERGYRAHVAAVVLAATGGIAFLGGILTFFEQFGAPLSAGLLFAVHAVVTAIAMLAAMEEWSRERLGEFWAVTATMGAVLLTFIALVNGWWYYAPAIGLAALASMFAVLNRFLVRDESHHMPSDSDWAL